MPSRSRALGLLLAALVAAASIGAATPAPAEAATPRLKAVVIVGPSGSGLQASNLADGEEIARTAESYGMEVRRVFHPYATWSRVLANIQDASIVAYLGHGNGWPSPYAPFQTTTKNGFGLNPYDGASTNETKYYGEGPIADNIRLAPNAVVLLNHLCYASGNSEPGHAAPTVAVARERVDNYGAGFLRSGARAVFAYGHQDVSDVVDALFTTNATMDQIFMGRGYVGGYDQRFASVRTPGYSVHMDPANATSFYRSVIGNLAMTASQVVGPPPGTDVAPDGFVVPGAGSVTGVEAAWVYETAGGAPISQLDPGTKVRLAEGPVNAGGGEWFRLSLPTAGWMPATSLNPEDSIAPRVDSLVPAASRFSPNGDGVSDTVPVTATFSESGTWWMRFQRLDGTSVKNFSGIGSTVTRAWNGTSGTTVLPDGQYRVAAMSTDDWGNVGAYRYASVWIDTQAPAVSGLTARSVSGAYGRTPSGAAVAVVSPNGDGIADAVTLAWSSSEAGTAVVTATGASGLVRSFTTTAAAGAGSTTWNGRTNAGTPAPDGAYTLAVRVRDAAGNLGAARTIPVLVHSVLKSPAAAPTYFYSRDRDALAPSTTFRFTLAAPATVTWVLLDPAGAPLLTRLSGAATAAGTHAWTWDGRTASGAFAADGKYTISVTAKTAAGSVTQRLAVYNSAFRIAPSVTSVARGQSMTVTLFSAEPLLRNPTLTVWQPGLAYYSVATTKIGTNAYRAIWTVRTGGTAGTARLRAYGWDTGSTTQATYGSLTIR